MVGVSVNTNCRAGRLPFKPEIVGWHWGRQVQIDVVGVNWKTKDLLLGECKWIGDPLNRKTVRDLIESKAPQVLHGLLISADEWGLHYAFFSWNGFTEAAAQMAKESDALLISLETLDEDLIDV